MGIIQKQSIYSSIFILIGFVIGAINIMLLYPMFFTKTEIGLVRAIIDTGLTLSIFCTFGSLSVIYKFYPFYDHYLDKTKTDLPFYTLLVNIVGFFFIILIGITQKEFIIRKLGKSPVLANNFNYIYPFTFFLMLFYWLETFAWGIHKTIISNFLKETGIRIITSILIILYGIGWINLDRFLFLFSGLYIIPCIWLLIVLLKSKKWKFNFIKFSSVSKKLKKRIGSFAMFAFASQFFSLLAKTNDTFLIFGIKGLAETGIFATALFIAAVMDIPQRSITSISVPVLSKSWRDKDLVNIKNIYLKSVSNLLTIGFFLFGLIVLNVHNIVDFLNWIGKKDGLNYDVLIELVFIFGIARLIDLGTGVNSQIIGTSNYWKFDFFSNLFYIILSLPLNYYLIKYFGLTGLALSNLFALALYNTYRFIFLYIKFKFQPYNIKHLKFIMLNVFLILIVYNLSATQYLFLNILIKSTSFIIGFSTIFYFIKPSDELSKIINDFAEKLNISFLKRF